MFVTKKRYDVARAHADYASSVSKGLAEKLDKVSTELEKLRNAHRALGSAAFDSQQLAKALQIELDTIKNQRLANLANANAKRRAAKEKA